MKNNHPHSSIQRAAAALALALSALSVAPAFAAPLDQGSGSYVVAQRDGRDDHRGADRGDWRRDNGRPDPRMDDRGDRHWDGAGPNHNWHKGDRLPTEYRHHNYVVNDWRGHHLSAPPRGYQWVQNGGDYILVAAATGIIAQILLGH